MSAAETEIDPVCGMQVATAGAKHRSRHAGREFYFCCEPCRTKFEADPARFLSRTESAARIDAHAESGAARVDAHERTGLELDHEETIGAGESDAKKARVGSAESAREKNAPTSARSYTCPMHPEIVRDAQGSCPICGMALEPREITVEEDESDELVDMRRRFWISVAFTLPLAVLEMGPHLSGVHRSWLPARSSAWIELLLATPVVLWCAAPIFVRAWASIVHASSNMFTLIALGTGIAYAYSVCAVLLADSFPPSLRNGDGDVALYFESPAAITALVLLGQVLELSARRRTGAAVRALLKLAPKTARLLQPNGAEIDVPLDAVEVGALLRVRPGESVPVDGHVIEGRSFVDESMMTGESSPLEKSAGSQVTGGTLNGSGGFTMTAEQVGGATTLARIVRLVNEAQRSRAPIQRLADSVSAAFVPAVIGIALVTFAVWAMLGPDPRIAHALVNAVAVLVIACPCALGLATPMSILVASGRGARAGVLFKSAEALETLQRIDTLVIDKTGTLTEGRPRLVSVEAAKGTNELELLALAASLEQASEHPIARAIVDGARERRVPIAGVRDFRAELRDFRSVTGAGVAGVVDERRVEIGTEEFVMRAEDREPSAALRARAESLRARGETVVFVSIDSRTAGILGVADPVKESARAAVRELEADGLHVIMLTGDKLATAQHVAREVGIEDVRADVRPDEKAAVVRELRASGHKVAMAGDGVNDAPALALADVGIAMGTGTDVAIESASLTLVRGDLRGILRARRLSRATTKNIRQNLAFAFGYNVLGVPIAAGILYPAFGLLLSPVIASAAMSASSICVIANALQLRRARL
jgi:P-type Cu+ transporter